MPGSAWKSSNILSVDLQSPQQTDEQIKSWRKETSKASSPLRCQEYDHIFCLGEGTLSLHTAQSLVEQFHFSSCFSPLLNNMLEHPKANSIWEALVTAGHKHQRSKTRQSHLMFCAAPLKSITGMCQANATK